MSSSPSRQLTPVTKPDSRAAVRLMPVTTPPVRDRGPLMDAREVARVVFNGKVSWRYVLEHVPSQFRVKLGNRVCFRQHDVQAWLDQLSDEAPR